MEQGSYNIKKKKQFEENTNHINVWGIAIWI